MRFTSFISLGVSCALAGLAAGCSSGDDDSGDACHAPVIDGAPAFSSGTASVHGSGTLPAGLPDGYELELLLNSGMFSVGVLPNDLFANTDVCGRAFSFEITQVAAGTYHLDYELFDHHSSSLDAAYQGTSTNTFTVADGQTVEFTPSF